MLRITTVIVLGLVACGGAQPSVDRGDAASIVSTSTSSATDGSSPSGDLSPTLDGGAPTVSANGATIPSASQLVDAAGNIWTLTGGVVYENGSPAGYTSGVTLLLYENGVIYQENGSGDWWSWTNGAWVGASDPRVTTAPPSGVFGIKVSGNKFVSTLDGSPVQIIGENVSGLENGHQSHWTAFKNAGTAFWSQLKSYQGWGINTVRLPLNEAPWLNYTCYDGGSGSSGAFFASATGGGYATDPDSEYQATVKQVVADATASGLYVILDLHWGAPNGSDGKPLCPVGQPAYADADHSVTFWKQVADMFKDNPAVIFELFNEPFGTNDQSQIGSGTTAGPDAVMLANGGSDSSLLVLDNATSGFYTDNVSWNVASMITLIHTIRDEGASNVILAAPIYWAANLANWIDTYTQSGNPDPLHQLAASWHVYGYANGPSAPLAVLAAGYPIAITETYGFDSNLDGGRDGSGYTWAKSNGIGFLCWGVVNDWSGDTLSLTATPPYASCPAP